jgi:alpha,alpha-trehalose phosphorylase
MRADASSATGRTTDTSAGGHAGRLPVPWPRWRTVLKRSVHLPPKHLYPTDPWRLVESGYSERYFERAETAFSLSNGYLGIRGSFDEGRPARSPGTFVNGFHETWPIAHTEEAYGLARTGQTMVAVPDATVLRLYVDDEPLFVPTARVRHYIRVLDMQAGTLTRELRWTTGAGKHVVVRSCRLVSLEHRHLAAVLYEVVLPEDEAPVAICSQVLTRQDMPSDPRPEAPGPADPRRAKRPNHRVLNVEVADARENRLLLGYRTTNSGMTLGIGVDHHIETAASHEIAVSPDPDAGEMVVTAEPTAGVPIRIVKYMAYQSSRSAPPAELVDRCVRTLDRVARDGFDALRDSQRQHLDHFWDRADVRVGAGARTARTQQAIRWNMFQVAQATWRAEGSGVPAKGLTGQAYEGHYFWDTELYLVPLLAYTQPRIARNLLRFRHSMLPRAREQARAHGHRGALFPWRTINGEEASAYYEAGTAQYHLNADIAHAVRRYVEIRGDRGFLEEVGAELLVETARLWEDLGFHAPDGAFHIHSVTGPDEYTTLVNDNAYTNLMARANLSFAALSLRRLEAERPEFYAALADEVGLTPAEIEAWERAAVAMHVPYDEQRGIHPQDASFLDREVWNLEQTPPDRFPLLLHYHPLVIYRHQVLKQADVVLAMLLLGDQFSDEQKRANFEYYDKLTTGDSSLSACTQSVIAAEIGDEERALEYFRFALLMDLADVAGNASDGVHIASAAGVWHALVLGFGGVRSLDGALSITPRLPGAWDSLAFSLRFHGRQLRVQLTHAEERVVIEDGEPLELTIDGRSHVVTRDQPIVLRPALR